MLEIIVHCYMTSRDALDIARKLAELEKTAITGGSTEVKVWRIQPNVSIVFTLDQERATKQGLMKSL